MVRKFPVIVEMNREGKHICFYTGGKEGTVNKHMAWGVPLSIYEIKTSLRNLIKIQDEAVAGFHRIMKNHGMEFSSQKEREKYERRIRNTVRKYLLENGKIREDGKWID